MVNSQIIFKKLNRLAAIIAALAFFSIWYNVAQSVTCPDLKPGDLFKVPDSSAVYLVNSKQERLYFPTSEIFHTWYENFSTVQEINHVCVDRYPAPTSPPYGVNYRPGARLVKVTISPTVYAVLPGNTLAKVGSEDVARALYGESWSKLVRDIADPFWPNYVERANELTTVKAHDGMLVRLIGRDTVYKVQNGQLYTLTGTLPKATATDVRELSDLVFTRTLPSGQTTAADTLTNNPAQEGVKTSTPAPIVTPPPAPITSTVTSTPVTETSTTTAVSPSEPKPLPPPTPIQHFCGRDIPVPEETPYIQVAIDAACNGDSIIVSPGTYYENLKVEREGITLKAAPRTKPEQVIIDGSGKDTVVYVSLVKSFTIDGFTLQNAGQRDNPVGNSGLLLNVRWKGDITARNLIVRKNGFGVVLWNADDRTVTLSRNLIVDNVYDGIVNANTSPARLVVANNTIVNNGRHGYTDNKRETLETLSLVLKNNIIVNNRGAGVYVYQSEARDSQYNNLWNNTKGRYVAFRTGEDSSFSPSPGTGELSVDPRFISSTDFHLQATSPMINAGKLFETDPDGSRIDIGAYPF